MIRGAELEKLSNVYKPEAVGHVMSELSANHRQNT